MATTGDEARADAASAGARQPRPVALLDRRSLNLPNAITLARLLLAGVLFVMIQVEGLWIASAIVFVVAAATDAIDGWIARRYGLITTLGRILDPFVDKIIVCGAFVFLLEKNDPIQVAPEVFAASGVTAWMVIIVIGREMFVSSLRGFLEQQGLDFSASLSGKLKMFMQCVAVTASLLSLSPHFADEFFRQVRDALLWGAVLVTAWSGLVYVLRAATLLRRHARD
ncbi:MAG: CDP-diacylglycerol--glycerol-3-phosphate 3-phosphatidyltransferase [Planctomycetaceae bacterium]